MKTRIADVAVLFLGRRTAWRAGRSLYLNARADAPNIARLNGEEHLQRQLLAHFARSGERLVVCDVGAHVGNWTWFVLEDAARTGVGPQLEVHCFEPVPSTCAVLQQRVRQHDLGGRVRVSCQALSSEEGVAEMFLAHDSGETSSLHPDGMTSRQQRVTVSTTTLDSYCARQALELIHFVKCDAEGHDLNVIRGAHTLIEQQRIAAIQFEYNHRWVYARHYLKDVFDAFAGSAYSVGKVTPRGIELYSRWHPELERFFEGNYILLHERARDWFTTIAGEYDARGTFCPGRGGERHGK